MDIARTATAAVADRIRIEDEVWDEAFASRVSSRRRQPPVVKTRPAQIWFNDPADEASLFGVDAPAGLDGLDGPDVPDVPDGLYVNDPLDTLDRPNSPDRPYGVPAPAPGSMSAMPRRTIRIQGRGAERNLPVTQRGGHASPVPRRRSPLPYHRSGFEPDRLAMWAMVLGVALMVVAILSSSL